MKRRAASFDLVGENVDVSLRMGPLEDSGLVSRKIFNLTRVVCASPTYLARHGRPAEPADLVRHACLILSRNPGSASWPFRINGKLIRIDVKGPVSADSADMLLQLAIGGAGILRLCEHVVARSIHEGLLQPLLQDAQDPETYPLYSLLPPGRHQAPKVRVFIDFLIERLGSAPWRTGSANHGSKSRQALNGANQHREGTSWCNDMRLSPQRPRRVSSRRPSFHRGGSLHLDAA